MKLDLQSLSAEPLVYMLMHSGAFVTALGIIFFLIGLLFGMITWGRYKGQSRELRAEAEAMKEEVANLKRKLADLSVKTGPAIPMVTEMITMPRRENPTPPPPAAVVAPASETKKSADNSPPPAVVAAPVSTPASVPAPTPAPEQPALPPASVIKVKTPAQPESGANGTSAPLSTPTAEPAPASPPPAHASVAIPITPDAAAAAGHHASPLAAIIAPAATNTPKKEPDAAPGKDLLMLPEIPIGAAPQASAAPKSFKHDFDFDSQLGLVYRAQPESIDDLTALKGVARPLEQRLNVLGVYTYEQIASWTHDQVREFSARLAFKDRIEREQWVEQARELLASQQANKRQLEASLA